MRVFQEARRLASLVGAATIAATPCAAGLLPTSMATIGTASPPAADQIYWSGWGCVPWPPESVLGSSVSGLVVMRSGRPSHRYAYRSEDCPYYGYYVTQADSPDYFGRFYAGSFSRPGYERWRHPIDPARRRH